MTKIKRRLAALFAATMLVGAVGPAAALATGDNPPSPSQSNCNAGRGNGSEGCDPGKSSTNPNGSTGQNQGGDEGGPIRGGTGVS